MPASVDGKQLVIDGVDIAAEIGQSVKLKPAGRELRGLCPFHDEKTPSFYVIPHKQFFYCHGCKAGGNVIDFVMRRDRLEFGPALRLLAEQHNIELPKLGRDDGGKSDERQQLYDALAAAAAFFQKQLRSPAGEKARDYLKKRGFTGETARDFGLGYAPDSFDALKNDPAIKKFPDHILEQADLVKRSDRGGFYDSFRDRVMFPIRDEQGRTIAFGGRVLPGGEHPAKYLNSKESPLFHKSRVAFGLDRAKDAIVKSRTVAVVEGYTDVVTAHQCGATNVVSVLGTALTPEHVKLLGRFAEKVVLVFDADAAGAGATQRSIELFLTQDIEIAIATLPAGTDPDEFLLNQGAEEFAVLVDLSRNPLDYQWDLVTRHSGSITEHQKHITDYLELLVRASVGKSIKAERLQNVLALVAYRLRMDVGDLRKRLRQIAVEMRASPASELQGKRTWSATLTAEQRARRQLLAALIDRPEAWAAVQDQIGPEDFGNPGEPLRELAERYWDHQRHEGEPELREWLPTLGDMGPAVMDLLRQHAPAGGRDGGGGGDDGAGQAVAGALEYFLRLRRRQQERELVGSAPRTTRELASAGDRDADADRLRAIAANAAREDLGRRP